MDFSEEKEAVPIADRLRQTAETLTHKDAAAIRIVPWNDRCKKDFIRLSTLWIKQYFVLEPADEELLSDPYRNCIETGGEIFVAVDTQTDTVAGVCALIHHPADQSWELAKLCVDPRYRGHGLGERLIDAVIDLARKKSAEQLFLESNTVLTAAIALYRKKGFVETPLKESKYRRVDIRMVKSLNPGRK